MPPCRGALAVTALDVAGRLRAVHDGRATMLRALSACDATSGRSHAFVHGTLVLSEACAEPVQLRLKRPLPLDTGMLRD